MAQDNTCSKCSGELNTDGYPKWCKACRKLYRESYDDMRMSREQDKGFAAGVRQTKEILAGEFERLGSGNFSGYEIAELIRQARGPLLD